MVNSNSIRFAKVVIVGATTTEANKSPSLYLPPGSDDLVIITLPSDLTGSNVIPLKVVQEISQPLPIFLPS